MKIVTLVPAATSMVRALGLGDRIVGVAHEEPMPRPPFAVDVGHLLSPDRELMRRLDPHVVFVGVGAERAATRFPSGRTTVVTLDLRRLRGVATSIRRVGRAVGSVARSEQVADSIVRALRAVGERAVTRRPRVLWVVGDGPLVAAGNGTLLDDLLRLAGAENAMDGAGAWPQPSAERIVLRAPDLVLWSVSTPGPDRSRPPWSVLPAARDGRVVPLAPDRWLEAGPGVVGLVEELHRILHGTSAPTGEPNT